MQTLCFVHFNRPRPLELTAVGENIVMDNLEVFRKNGFQFEMDHEGMLTYQQLCKCSLFVMDTLVSDKSA